MSRTGCGEMIPVCEGGTDQMLLDIQPAPTSLILISLSFMCAICGHVCRTDMSIGLN